MSKDMSSVHIIFESHLRSAESIESLPSRAKINAKGRIPHLARSRGSVGVGEAPFEHALPIGAAIAKLERGRRATV